VLAIAAGYIRWDHNQHGYYYWASDETKAAVATAKAKLAAEKAALDAKAKANATAAPAQK